MICKACGKENLEEAKYCISCGADLKEDFQICSSCGAKNSMDAKFCKKCGTSLNTKKVCPNCGIENKKEANYCKACGTKLNGKAGQTEKGQKKIGTGRLILSLISLRMCTFILVLCFNSASRDFLKVRKMQSNLVGVLDESDINLFNVIKNISNIRKNSGTITIDSFGKIVLGSYGKAAFLIPNIVSLLGILTAIIGCIVAIVLAIIQIVKSTVKRELPNLERYAIMSTGFLLAGLIVVSLSNFEMNSYYYDETYKISFQFGPVVLAALCIGIIWMFISHIAEIVFRYIENCSTTEIRDRIFKVVEGALLLVLLFNLSSSFARITFVLDESSALSYKFSSLVYFRCAYIVAGLYKMNNGSFPKELTQSLVMSPILLVFLLVFIGFGILFFIRRFAKKNNEAPKPSLCCGIVFMSIAVLLLILTCIAAPMIYKESALLQLLTLNSADLVDNTSSMVSANIIVFVIFAGALLALEFVGWVLFIKD